MQNDEFGFYVTLISGIVDNFINHANKMRVGRFAAFISDNISWSFSDIFRRNNFKEIVLQNALNIEQLCKVLFWQNKCKMLYPCLVTY